MASGRRANGEIEYCLARTSANAAVDVSREVQTVITKYLVSMISRHDFRDDDLQSLRYVRAMDARKPNGGLMAWTLPSPSKTASLQAGSRPGTFFG